jgi:hypothetical protein
VRGLHAIYLANHSTGARIEGNTFQDFCGSAIKLRDASSGATITGNHFRDADKRQRSRNGSATWRAPTNAPRRGANAPLRHRRDRQRFRQPADRPPRDRAQFARAEAVVPAGQPSAPLPARQRTDPAVIAAPPTGAFAALKVALVADD